METNCQIIFIRWECTKLGEGTHNKLGEAETKVCERPLLRKLTSFLPSKYGVNEEKWH